MWLEETIKPRLPSFLADESFDWETDGQDGLLRLSSVWFAVGFAYLPLIFGLRSIAARTRPLRRLIKPIWGVWNLGLATFSAIGAALTARQFFQMLSNFSGACDVANQGLSGTAAQWTFFFIVSKMVELGDSVFLALLDKPINFLHWYHHLTIFVFMFFSGLSWHPHLISGVFWNYNVHAAMYLYYGCSCFGLRWPAPAAMAITCLQVLQMFAQIGLTVTSVVVCNANFVGHYAALVMYAVYFVLFLEFFVGRYSNKPRGEIGGKKKTS